MCLIQLTNYLNDPLSFVTVSMMICVSFHIELDKIHAYNYNQVTLIHRMFDVFWTGILAHFIQSIITRNLLGNLGVISIILISMAVCDKIYELYKLYNILCTRYDELQYLTIKDIPRMSDYLFEEIILDGVDLIDDDDSDQFNQDNFNPDESDTSDSDLDSTCSELTESSELSSDSEDMNDIDTDYVDSKCEFTKPINHTGGLYSELDLDDSLHNCAE